MAVAIQPYVFSSSSFLGGSDTSSGDSVVLDLSVTMSRCNCSTSKASTRTIGQSVITRAVLMFCVREDYFKLYVTGDGNAGVAATGADVCPGCGVFGRQTLV